ncbi:MAG: ABC transporter substrate-binding protein [Patescibacteria group bacterium]|nr:ABC transporter substrate-binding protein [Patescibacteria group bacterium]
MKQFALNFFKRLKNGSTKGADETSQPLKIPSVLEDKDELDKKLVFSLAKQRFPTWQQVQYLSQYLSKKEKLLIRGLIVITLAALVILAIRFYFRHVEYLPQNGGTYTEALVGQPQYINPVLAQGDIDRDITSLVYAGLFRYDAGLKLVTDLASSYELSEDKKTYTIHLRENVYWHNGNAILADDVVFTFETIQDPEYKSPYYQNFQGVAIERIDDRTVTFTLPEPFAPFLSNLTVGIIPGHIWGDIGPSNFHLAEYNTRPVGSGPLQFKKLTKDRSGNIKSYELTRYGSYHGSRTYIDGIILKFYPDFESAITAVKNNNVDGISYLPKESRNTLNGKRGYRTYSFQLPQYTAVFFNQKNELLKNKELKQALAYATDKKRILTEALKGLGKSINGPILPGFLGYHPDIKKYSFDPAKAAELLDQAGWKVPEGGGLRAKNGAELKFSLTTVDQTEYLNTANILRENWEAIGVGIELKIMNPLRVDKEVIKPKDYEAFLYGEILGSDPDPYPFWHSSQSTNGGLNLSNYYNKEVDKLLEEGRKIDATDERAQKYRDFQNIIAEEMPALFLYSPSYDYYTSDTIKGITTTRINIPSDRFSGISGWYIKTRLGWQ